MSDYELAVELARAWVRHKHPETEIEAVPEGEVGAFFLRAGRAASVIRVFILPGYRGFIYPGRYIPIPQCQTRISKWPINYFIFQERHEYAYIIKGKTVQGSKLEEFGELGKCQLVPKEDVESIADLVYSGFLDRIRGTGKAVPAGVLDAGASQHAERVQEIGPLFEASARPEVAKRPDDDYSGL